MTSESLVCRFSFAAMVVVGDGKGKVGWGYGKANEVPPSVEKARKEAMRSMVTVPLDGSTIAHVTEGRYGAAHVIMLPAAPGAGVIAGSAVRAVCEAAGIHEFEQVGQQDRSGEEDGNDEQDGQRHRADEHLLREFDCVAVLALFLKRDARRVVQRAHS